MFAIGKPGNQLKDMDTTLEKTVILWGQDDVLTRAVENLLTTKGDWKVIRISDDLDELTLAQVVEQVTPDVVIVHEGVFSGDMRPLIKFVQDYPKLKIITIGLENNKMDIYTKKTMCIKEPSDLLAAIKIGTVPEM
jgi:DNA-binding NarL/FixJ family response regulator